MAGHLLVGWLGKTQYIEWIDHATTKAGINPDAELGRGCWVEGVESRVLGPLGGKLQMEVEFLIS
jgi:hypothetical protein